MKSNHPNWDIMSSMSKSFADTDERKSKTKIIPNTVQK